jgi:hypothetical protein
VNKSHQHKVPDNKMEIVRDKPVMTLNNFGLMNNILDNIEK